MKVVSTKFLVYYQSKPFCKWCEAAKNLLTARGVPFDAVDLATPSPESALGFERIRPLGWRSVPAIFEITDDGEIKQFVGGFDKLEALLETRI